MSTESNHVTEFLQYALEQVHPLIRAWYGKDDLAKQLLEDVQRDAHEYFASNFALAFASGRLKFSVSIRCISLIACSRSAG